MQCIERWKKYKNSTDNDNIVGCRRGKPGVKGSNPQGKAIT